MTPSTTTVMLVVDDDERYRDRLVRALAGRGLDVHGAATGGDALAVAASVRPDCAVVDLRMPGMDGLELVAALRAQQTAIDVVVLTGFGSIATATEAMRRGARDYLTKPADADDILAAFGEQPDARSAAEPVPSLARVEWEHIQRVLAAADGNITRAARMLGIHRRSLQRKLAQTPPPD